MPSFAHLGATALLRLFPSLTKLDLSENSAMRYEQTFNPNGSAGLTELNCHACRMLKTSQSVKRLSEHFPNVTWFDLGGEVPVTKTMMQVVSQSMSSLVYIGLAGCKTLTDEMIRGLHLPELKELNLTWSYEKTCDYAKLR